MVRKAVIPAAGFGTRFLPLTKNQPKEMIPVIDTPVIQRVVEEAVESGITDILMIIGKSKRAIEEHFDRNFELENQLEAKGKLEELETIRKITSMADIHFVWQKEMNGLGDAIRYARHHVGREPFAVLLGDTIIQSENGPLTRQLKEVHNEHGESVIALEEVDRQLVSRYGVISGKATGKDGVYKLDDLVEKPEVDKAPSNLVIASRYILHGDVFDYLENVKPGKNNEIQLTDALRMMLDKRAMYGLHFKGTRFDLGNKMDFLKTNISLALGHPEVGMELKAWLKELAKTL
jgi:UTP--glucose-1-phosphate uridylyltransferase